MVITIRISDKKDYNWLRPFLDALKSTSAVIEVKGNLPDENKVAEKRLAYLKYLEQNPIPVTKVEIPSRDERNER